MHLRVDRSLAQENTMSNISYVSESQSKTSLRPSRQAIKRAALALAGALAVAGAADFGRYYLTTADTWKRPMTPMSRPTPRSSRQRSRATFPRCWLPTTRTSRQDSCWQRIDDRDFRTALKQAQADVAGSEAAVKNLNTQIDCRSR